ncbi:MAG: hypothetical protein L0216_18360 [Planctomycetales bacterium]|nr:hypothetical protein [Planctomycetales bacterium]
MTRSRLFGLSVVAGALGAGCFDFPVDEWDGNYRRSAPVEREIRYVRDPATPATTREVYYVGPTNITYTESAYPHPVGPGYYYGGPAYYGTGYYGNGAYDRCYDRGYGYGSGYGVQLRGSGSGRHYSWNGSLAWGGGSYSGGCSGPYGSTYSSGSSSGLGVYGSNVEPSRFSTYR